MCRYVLCCVIITPTVVLYCCYRDKSKDDKGKEKKRKTVTQKDQRQEDEDGGEGQWEKVVGGKGQNQEAIFQDKVKQLFLKDTEINEKSLLKKRQELLDSHCKTVRIIVKQYFLLP